MLLGSLAKTPLSTLTYAHTLFEKLFQDALPPGFNRDQVDVFLEGYAAFWSMEEGFKNLNNEIVGQLARLDTVEKEIEVNAADLDEEVQETQRDCQHRHPEGPTTHQISVKALRCDFRLKRTEF